MSWLDQIQLGDLENATRLELRCKKCLKVRFVTVDDLLANGDYARLWLDEVQARARCRQRSCGGHVRLSLAKSGETKGFVGGIA